MMRIFHSPAFSPLALAGWALIIGGGGWDLIYHFAPFAGVKWSPFIDMLGEFGHTVILVGMAIVVFAVLWANARKNRLH